MTYVRWGKKGCPKGVEMVYTGNRKMSTSENEVVLSFCQSIFLSCHLKSFHWLCPISKQSLVHSFFTLLPRIFYLEVAFCNEQLYQQYVTFVFYTLFLFHINLKLSSHKTVCKYLNLKYVKSLGIKDK